MGEPYLLEEPLLKTTVHRYGSAAVSRGSATLSYELQRLITQFWLGFVSQTRKRKCIQTLYTYGHQNSWKKSKFRSPDGEI